MNYAGNSSLSRDVQQRVLDTFEQTLNLAAEGSRQEALLGCDFVLRMDPQFEPARRLQDRLRASSGAIVDLDDLRPSAPPIQAPADLFASLDGLGLELPDLPPDSFATDLRTEIAALLEQRRFQELMTLAHQNGPAIAADPELQSLLQQAQEQIEAEPYVNKFIASAQAAWQAGQTDEVLRLVEKARALDPTHPALADLEAAARAPRSAPQGDEIAADLAGFDLSFDSPSLDLGLDLGGGGGPAESSLPSLDSDLFGGGGGEESDPRIRQLLDEGQRAFDGGDPQGAIDAWSRIFLIDIDHPEAARRIDQARKLKAESERQVEEIFHDGVARLEVGDMDAARREFERVLEMQPSYAAAREYLQQIETGRVPAPTPRGTAGAPGAVAGEALLSLDNLGPIDDLKEEILVPPDPGGAAATEKRPAAKKGKGGGARAPRQMFVLVGSVVLLLVLGGGWYVFQNRDQFFPNSQSEAGAEAPGADPIARAQALHDGGKTATAISQLRRLPPSDPHYQQAQALIAQWGATLEPGAGGPPAGAVPAVAGGPAAPVIPAPQLALLNAARQALAEGSRLEAVEYFEKAAEMGKLGPEETALLADARTQLEPLSRQINLFRQHEWEFILNDLWRLHDERPNDRDVTRLIVDSYYNLGVRDLQRSDPHKAAAKFEEVLKLAPGDEALRRHYLFAQTYQEQPKDLLYRIYVKYLALR